MNSGIIICGANILQFNKCIHYHVDTNPELAWALNYFWGTEIRGMKDAYTHPMSMSPQDCIRVLRLVTEGINTSYGTWYIDIGLEFILGGQALLWLTDAHSKIMQAALRINESMANRVISRQTKYVQDVSSHLQSLSGFRAILKADNNLLSAVYMQIYTTDKSQTYHPENGQYGETLMPKEAMHGNPPTWCQSLLNLYHGAACNVDVAARIEVHCPLEFAEDCLVVFPKDTIWTSLTCYHCKIWW